MKIKRRTTKPARIEMMPLIDVIFLLLVFFIYAMLSMAVHQGLHLDLPQSSLAEPTTEKEPLSLSVRKGAGGLEVFLDKQPVPLQDLHNHPALRQPPSNQPAMLVFADRTVSYQQLYTVLDELKKSGVRNISLQAGSE